MSRVLARVTICAMVCGLVVSPQPPVSADEPDGRLLNFPAEGSPPVFDPVTGSYVRLDRATSTMMISGNGTICHINSSAATSAPFQPFTSYRGPINFAVGSFAAEATRPTALFAGSGGSDELPMRVFDFGPPPSLLGEVPMPGIGGGLLITSANLFGDPTHELVLSNARSGGELHIVSLGSDDAFTIQPFPGYKGGLRTAAGDFDGNGVNDVAVTQTENSAAVKILEVGDRSARAIAHGVAFTRPPAGGLIPEALNINGDRTDELLLMPGSADPFVFIYNLAPASPVLIGRVQAFDRPLSNPSFGAGLVDGRPAIFASSGSQIRMFAPSPDGTTWLMDTDFNNVHPFGPIGDRFQMFIEVFTPNSQPR